MGCHKQKQQPAIGKNQTGNRQTNSFFFFRQQQQCRHLKAKSTPVVYFFHGIFLHINLYTKTATTKYYK